MSEMETRMLVTVKVFYRTDREGLFFAPTFSPETFALDFGYEFEAIVNPADPDLERLWRMTNRVDGSAIEVVPPGRRSLSVGDVLVVGETAWFVASIGFEVLDAATMIEALERVGDPMLVP